MPDELVWIEDGDSRQATIVRKGKKAASSYVTSYKVFGTADDTVLHTAINAKITSSMQYWQYPGVQGMQLRAEQYSVSYLGDNAWQITIQYEKNGAEDGTEPLKRARSFDTTGGTQHITQGKKTGTRELDFASEGEGTADVYENRFPSSAPDQQGAIAVDGNGVNGVDIVVPQLQWQETYDVPNTYVTSAWIRRVAGVSGTTNAASFRGFDAGEVLFMGCSGSQEWDDQKGKGPWSLTFRFVASRNVTGQKIGDVTGVSKKGHEYLWVHYETASDSSSQSLIKKPKYVYVNKVYDSSDFSKLGIGTT
jgi:hypothetical protein